jgi:NADH dehydrogenase/NADH:ubiquinone oxidoreductase subunit G
MKIKIDNKELDVLEGEKLIKAARRNGIDIPSLCYEREKSSSIVYGSQ